MGEHVPQILPTLRLRRQKQTSVLHSDQTLKAWHCHNPVINTYRDTLISPQSMWMAQSWLAESICALLHLTYFIDLFALCVPPELFFSKIVSKSKQVKNILFWMAETERIFLQFLLWFSMYLRPPTNKNIHLSVQELVSCSGSCSN